MVKVTHKKTAAAVAKKAAVVNKTASMAVKTRTTAKNKPASKKAAGEKPLLPDTTEQNSEENKVAAKITAKATTGKKTAAKKSAAKKSSAKKTTAKTASKAKSKVSAKAAHANTSDAKAATQTVSKRSTKKVAKSAAKKSTPKEAASKKVPASKSKNSDPASISAESPETEYDDTDTDGTDVSSTSQSTVVPYERDSSGHYMDPDQLEHFSQKLAEWKQQLMEEVDRTVGHMKDDATNFPDPNDRATQEEEFSLELRTRDRERKLIKKINEAQKRIDDDEYGYCETCGIEIGVNRLEARPTAELCIDCKTLEEIRERQTA